MDLVDEAWGAAILSAVSLEDPASPRDLLTASRGVAGVCLGLNETCPTKVVSEGSPSLVTIWDGRLTDPGGLGTKAGPTKLGPQAVEHWIGAACQNLGEELTTRMVICKLMTSWNMSCLLPERKRVSPPSLLM